MWYYVYCVKYYSVINWLFLYWPWYRFEVNWIGPRPVVPRSNTADRESIPGQYRNNQLTTPLLNNSTYVVYTTNIRPAKLVLYEPYHFHMVFKFQTPVSLSMSRWTVKNFQYAFNRILSTIIQQGITLTMFVLTLTNLKLEMYYLTVHCEFIHQTCIFNPPQSSQFLLQIDARFTWLLHLWKPQAHCQRQPCQTTCL